MKNILQFQVGNGMINCHTIEPVPLAIFLNQMRTALDRYRQTAEYRGPESGTHAEPECIT